MKIPVVIHKLQSKIGVAVAASATTALVIGGIAYATIPDASGVIHGCYRSSGALANGQIRIIDSDSQTCNNNETEITWNQTGPQGPPGPAGPSQLVCVACTPRNVSVRLGSQSFLNADLDFANLYGTSLQEQNFENASFISAVLYGTHLERSNFTGANFTDTNLRSANFSDTDLTNANLTNADLTGTNLLGANMTNANLNGVLWNSTRCPDGTLSDDNGNTCEGHLVP